MLPAANEAAQNVRSERHSADACRISLHKGYKLDSIDFNTKHATFTSASGVQHVAPYDLIIGADGCFSRVRSEIARVDLEMTFTVVPNERGYKSCCGLPVPGE